MVDLVGTANSLNELVSLTCRKMLKLRPCLAQRKVNQLQSPSHAYTLPWFVWDFQRTQWTLTWPVALVALASVAGLNVSSDISSQWDPCEASKNFLTHAAKFRVSRPGCPEATLS